jgi:AcrR family transcriptional regulator
LTSEVLDKAASLFAKRGFAATNLQEIADAVGVSRPSIYYYFSSKEALLEQMVRGVTLPVTQIFDALDAASRLVLWVTDPHMHFKLIERTENELPVALANAHRASKRRVLDSMVKLIEAGIIAGEIRAVDPRVAAFAILGMCNWTASWFSASGPLSAKQLAAAIADLAVASVHRTSVGGSDIRSLTKSIRESIDLIEVLYPKESEKAPSGAAGGSSTSVPR